MPFKMLKPFKFRSGAISKNRCVLAPLTNMQSPTSLLSAEEFNWLYARAKGDFAILTTCASHVTKNAKAWEGELGNYSDQHIHGLTRLAELGISTGAFILPQLFHGGFRCPSALTGTQPVSSSEFQIDTVDFETPRALLETEILQLKADFVAAAVRSVRAGLPGVELHGANGYLFTQFLSPFTNRRNDNWGGSLRHRARFLIETTSEIRKAIGPDKILGVRLSPENTKLIPNIDIDEMKDVAAELHEIGVDYISLSLWDAKKIADKRSGQTHPKTIIEEFREIVPRETAIFASGKIWTHQDAEEVLNLGADFVALGASAIANPTWPLLNNASEIVRLPLTASQLNDRSVSQNFINYLKRWNFVKEEAN